MQVGETVRLKSGGPLMTVTGADAKGLVQCTWFENHQTDKASFSFFPSGALEKAEPEMARWQKSA